MATYRTQVFNNVNGRSISVAWYECPPESLEIVTTNGANLRRPGTNASFFVPNNGPMSALHIQNGRVVHTGGDTNVADAGNFNTRMSAMFFEMVLPGEQHAVPHTPRVVNRVDNLQSLINQLQYHQVQGRIMWALGGFTLFLGESIANEQALNSRYDAVFPNMRPTWIPGLGVGIRRARTFLAYSSSRNVVCFGVMSTAINFSSINGIGDNVNGTVGATYFDMYTILRNATFSCGMGISLDGGSSTRVRRQSGSPIEIRTTSARANVLCQVTSHGLQ